MRGRFCSVEKPAVTSKKCLALFLLCDGDSKSARHFLQWLFDRAGRFYFSNRAAKEN